MQNIIDILTTNCLQRIKEQTGFDDLAAVRLLSVHLDPRFFAMPIHGAAEEQKLFGQCGFAGIRVADDGKRFSSGCFSG